MNSVYQYSFIFSLLVSVTLGRPLFFGARDELRDQKLGRATMIALALVGVLIQGLTLTLRHVSSLEILNGVLLVCSYRVNLALGKKIRRSKTVSTKTSQSVATILILLACVASLSHFFLNDNPDEALRVFVTVLLVGDPGFLFYVPALAFWLYEVAILSLAALGYFRPAEAAIIGTLGPFVLSQIFLE